MPETIGKRYPYFELQFNKDGNLAVGDAGTIVQGLRDANTTDLFVISHGWNNDIDDARSLYKDLFAHVGEVEALPPFGDKPHRIAVLGVLWPSKRFDDAALIAGTAEAGAALSLSDAQDPLKKKIDGLQGVFSSHDSDAKLAQASQLVPRLQSDPAARTKFGELLLDIMRGAALESPPTPQNEDNSRALLAMHGDELFAALGSAPPAFGPGVGSASQGGALGGVGGPIGVPSTGAATGLGDIFHGVVDAARNLLNFTTYYEMKNRAGIVGRTGLFPQVTRIRSALPDVRMHLVGHSFGARVVTAAADGQPGQPPIMPASIALLQAAYSHYALASHWDGVHDGLFRAVLAAPRVSGPMIATCTKNDKAVGIAYAIASRIANQVASAIGGPDDKYGGMGRNGAQLTPEAVTTFALLDPAGPTKYAFTPGHIYNLVADQFIKGHSDIRNAPVAYALLTAAA